MRSCGSKSLLTPQAVTGILTSTSRLSQELASMSRVMNLTAAKKTFHGVGNVAKATWVSLGDHPYTGMFRGGDSGFVRLSTTFEVDNAN